MKIVAIIARLLLGIVFLVFGVNIYLHFIPMGPPPTGPMGQFAGALFVTHYIHVVGFFQVVPAVLLLINRYVPLALTLLGPVIVNILLTHFLMAPSGIPMALFVTILWFIVFFRVRSAFAGIFQSRVAD
jgi:putative oxidoreductase